MEDKFRAILKALEGVTVLETPRVSRTTIVSTLKEHTNLIHEIRHEMTVINKTMQHVSEEAAENRMFIQILREDTSRNQKGIEMLMKVTDEFRKQFATLSDQVDDLPVIKQQCREQKIQLEDLTMKFHVHVAELTEFVGKTNKSIVAVDQKCTETLSHLKEIEDYVNHFEETLILPSSQIRVETSAGFSDHPLSLLEVLSECNTCFEDLSTNTKKFQQKFDEHQSELNKKAPESVIFLINALERKVGNIEIVLQRDEDQGIGVLRRQCEQIISDIQSITSELQNKMDKEATNLIIHEKYDEIVKYLQDALHSSVEDEQNFKIRGDELQEMVFRLANSKCDRTEIAPIQEMLVKTEAMLRKITTTQSKETEHKQLLNTNTVNNGYNKREIEELLDHKVDKEQLEQQITSLMKMMKKSRRLSNVLPSAPSMSSNIVDLASPTTFNMNGLPGGGNTRQPPIDSGLKEQLLWKTLAENMREESNMALLRASNSNVSGNQVLNAKTIVPGSGASGMTSNQGGTGGGSGMGTTAAGGGNGKGGMNQSFTDSTYTQPNGASQLPSNTFNGGGVTGAASSAYNGNTNMASSSYVLDDSTSLSALPMPSQRSVDSESINNQIQTPNEYNIYLETKNLQPNKNVPTITVPAANPNNPKLASSLEFTRSVGGGGVGGGLSSTLANLNLSGSGPPSTVLNSGINSTMFPPQPNQDLSFLGGTITGGGYNLKSSNLMKPQSLKAASGFADNESDLEGTGFLLKGHDGRMYYTDEPETVSAKQATAKRIQPKTKK